MTHCLLIFHTAAVLSFTRNLCTLCVLPYVQVCYIFDLFCRVKGMSQSESGSAVYGRQTGHNSMYQTFPNDFQLTNMDNWNGKIENQISNQGSTHYQASNEPHFSRSAMTAQANSAYNSSNYGGVHAFNYSNNINDNSRFYQVNDEHLSTLGCNEGSHIERNLSTKLFNPFSLNPETATWFGEERAMPSTQARPYSGYTMTNPALTRSNSCSSFLPANEIRGNSQARMENVSRPRTLSNVLPANVSKPQMNTNNVPTFCSPYDDPAREFNKNAIIRSIQSSRTDSNNITTNPYSDYFLSQKLAEKIPPPVVKVEEGYDRPVPAKRSRPNFKLEKPSKVTEQNKDNRYDNPFTNDDPFTNNWIVQKSESQRIMEEHLATMTEARNWQNTLYPDVSKGKVPEGKPAQESEPYKCDWTNCGLIFPEQDDLVRHIEKVHIDQRKADDSFVCYWENCVRKQKPFNARYKLVIHMRVHSGERPNRCTVRHTMFSSIITCISPGNNSL